MIRALNEDLPYDRFVQYQLAADRIPKHEPRHLAALGFLSLGREFPEQLPRDSGRSYRCGHARNDGIDGGVRALPRSQVRSDSDQGLLLAVFHLFQHPRAEAIAAARKLQSTLAEAGALHGTAEADREGSIRNTEFAGTRRWWRSSRRRSADYLLAAHDAEKLSNTEVEELVRDRQLNQHVLARWRKYLRESKTSGEPVFQLWHAAAAIPDKEFAAKWREVSRQRELETRWCGRNWQREDSPLSKISPQLYAAVAREIRSGRTVSPILQRSSFAPWSADRNRRLMSPLDEFELIYTEGDNNNTRSIRVRYNTMLAQSAYDGAPPRAMAVEDVPHPTPAHVFIRGNANNPGRADAARISLPVSAAVRDKAFQRRKRTARTGARHH